MVEFLPKAQTPYIMACDSSDVLIMSTDGVIEQFEQFGVGVLLNAETNPYPDSDHLRRWAEARHKPPFIFLNAGAVMGKKEPMIDFYQQQADLKKVMPSIHLCEGCDQGYAQIIYRKLYPNVLIDEQCKIFQTLHGVKMDIEGDTINIR